MNSTAVEEPRSDSDIGFGVEWVVLAPSGFLGTLRPVFGEMLEPSDGEGV